MFHYLIVQLSATIFPLLHYLSDILCRYLLLHHYVNVFRYFIRSPLLCYFIVSPFSHYCILSHVFLFHYVTSTPLFSSWTRSFYTFIMSLSFHLGHCHSMASLCHYSSATSFSTNAITLMSQIILYFKSFFASVCHYYSITSLCHYYSITSYLIMSPLFHYFIVSPLFHHNIASL